MFDANQRVKIAREFGTKGAWEKKFIGTAGKVAGDGEPVKGASGKTLRVDLPSGGGVFVEPECLDAA